MSVQLLVGGKAPIRIRMIGIFHFFFENINQEHSLLPDCACLWTVYLVLVCKNACQTSLPSFYCTNWQHFVQIKINAKWNGNYMFSSASLSRVGDNSLAHKCRVMIAVKLHLNATYAQNLAQLKLKLLKSVYEKRQQIMGGQLFSSKVNV